MKTLIIDNFLKDPDKIRKFALSLNYRKRNECENFEGMRGPLIKEVNINMHQSKI